MLSTFAREFSKFATFWPVAVPGVAGFLIAMAIAWTRWPEPSMHDDFGNLLVATTLLEGRFANPVPSAWQSMETFHVIFQPSYASKYPVGLGVLFAIGKLLFGSFAAGLWICAGLASSAMAWMILAHFPRRWGLAAGLMTATHPYWQNGWSQEFTNGWLAVTGIALVLGGLLRIRRSYRQSQLGEWQTEIYRPSLYVGERGSCRARYWLGRSRALPVKANPPLALSNASPSLRSSYTAMVGLGCVLTLFSRPFEGGLVCGLLGLYFLPILFTRGLYLDPRFWRAAMPGMTVLSFGIALQLVINQSITGEVLKLPYQLHESQYGVAPVLIWQKPHEPSLGHRFAEQVTFHRGWSMDAYHRASSFNGYFEMLRRRLGFLVNHWGQLLAFAPVGLLVLQPERRRLIGMIGLLLIALLIINCIPWAVPQYVSPLIPIVLFIACSVARGLIKRVSKSLRLTKRPVGLEIALFASIILFQCCTAFNIAQARSSRGEGWETTWAEKRARILDQLSNLPGFDVVFVKYPADYDVVNCEWVFNEANIEQSQVLWGRWGSKQLNDAVVRDYSKRNFWLLEFDEQLEPVLSRY